MCAGTGRPRYTARVEQTLADFFGAEDACLVRGAGSGGLRSVLMAALKPGQKILLHQAPVYPTTQTTIEAMGLERVVVDYNQAQALEAVDLTGVDFALVQHARQQLQDRYVLAGVISALKQRAPQITVLVDDNYAALRAPQIGVQAGADISTFSLFKLLGPEGLGCVLAGRALCERIRKHNYSGGTQVQGPEALEALRALTLAPVALAVQGQTVAEVVRRLNEGELAGVKGAIIANAQSRVVLVELEQPAAAKVLEYSVQFGAAPHPVGSESRYEIAPLFYRISGTMRRENPELERRMIRINPMRAGADLVISILEKALRACQGD